MPQEISTLPFSFYMTMGCMICLLAEALIHRDRAWGIISLVVYFTIALWYVADLFQQLEYYAQFTTEELSAAYWQVLLFLIAYRLLAESLRRRQGSSQPWAEVRKRLKTIELNAGSLPVRRTLGYLLPIWALLLLIGIWRLEGDVTGALLPIAGRGDSHMWGRGALGGELGFLVATGAYVYAFICAAFGILLVLARQTSLKAWLSFLIAVAWPYYFFMGARNQLLAVVVPGVLTFLLVSRASWARKMFLTGVAIVLANYLMLAMLQFRNVGFQAVLDDPFEAVNTEGTHQGLGMIEELARINGYYDQGMLTPNYGRDYLAHALNFVPRAIWPEKPRVSYEYSLLRGQVLKDNETPTATVASGLIGQGFLNFGPFLGPICAAGLMALYAAFLLRQWEMSDKVQRLALTLVGVGLIPNLGREFTLLVLWPIIFGYTIARYIEWRSRPGGAPVASRAGYHRGKRRRTYAPLDPEGVVSAAAPRR